MLARAKFARLGTFATSSRTATTFSRLRGSRRPCVPPSTCEPPDSDRLLANMGNDSPLPCVRSRRRHRLLEEGPETPASTPTDSVRTNPLLASSAFAVVMGADSSDRRVTGCSIQVSQAPGGPMEGSSLESDIARRYEETKGLGQRIRPQESQEWEGGGKQAQELQEEDSEESDATPPLEEPSLLLDQATKARLRVDPARSDGALPAAAAGV